MARVDGLFKNLQLGPADAEAGRPLLQRSAPPASATGARGRFVPTNLRSIGAFDWFRASNTALAFEDDGGIDVGFRSTVIIVAMAKLLGTGIVAALAAVHATTAKRGLSCALAVGVNLVAVMYYRLILRVRSQTFEPEVYSKVALSLRKRTSPAAAAATAADAAAEPTTPTPRQKAMVQENIVDSLRSCDWLTTLVLMVLDLHFLAEEANPGGAGFLGPIWGSTLIAFVVSFGTVGRSFFNNLRPGTNADGSRQEQPCFNWIVSVGSFLCAMALFVTVYLDVLIAADYPDNAPTAAMRDDRIAIWSIVLVQWGYPVVFLVEYLVVRCTKPQEDEYSPNLSAFKDICYAVLDVSSKGGLALYAALRAVQS